MNGPLKNLARLAALLVCFLCAFGFAPPTVHAAAKALFIGIDDYADPQLKLMGVKEDVKLLTDELIRAKAFSRDQLKTLLDKQATKTNIVKTFKDFLIDGTKPGDTVYFYFSGHGVQVWDENGDEEDGKDEALLPYDSRFTSTPAARKFRGATSTAYSAQDTVNLIVDDELHGLLGRLKGRTVVFLSDSCHSGSVYKSVNPFFVRYKTPQIPNFYKSVLDPRIATPVHKALVTEKHNLGADLDVPDVKIAAFTASEDSQPAEVISFDRQPKGFHSVFTWYLLHAVRGGADLRKSGKITLGDVARYIETEVKRGGHNQVPQVSFKPMSLAEAPMAGAAEAPAKLAEPEKVRLERPTTAMVALKGAQGISATQLNAARNTLKTAIPALEWTDKPEKASCVIELETRGAEFGARLSDSSGAAWEPHKGADLPTVLKKLHGDLKAVFVQKAVAALRERDRATAVEMEYKVKSGESRRDGEVVNADRLIFRITARTAGYPYVFNVDAQGCAHPLFPRIGMAPTKLEAGKSLTLGEDGSFAVGPPFGKETLFCVLAPKPLESLGQWWKKDSIGDPDAPWLTDQAAFLEALWTELVREGRPAGDWSAAQWTLKSFGSM